MAKKRTLQHWSPEDSADLYGIRNWGNGYFDVSEAGDVVVRPFGPSKDVAVSIPEVIREMRERGLDMPVLLRVENILESQITLLHETFAKAIAALGYRGAYRGVFPIKVNQQQPVVEKIARYGAKYHHGLEVGSKAELLAALSQMDDTEACLICNGYKDEEFIDLGLYARQMGFRCIFVVEMPTELPLILERSSQLNVKPLIGVRAKLSAKSSSGHWQESGGERSTFGLTTAQIMDVVDQLKLADMLDCFCLLHFHLGSQVPNIRDIRAAVMEGSRIYAGLVAEGAPMGYLDLGGGLAVDYDGSRTNFFSSRNYSLDEYCTDVLEAVMTILDEGGVAHPHIVTESGRATVAYYSMLLFNVLDVSRIEYGEAPLDAITLSEGDPDTTKNLAEVYTQITMRNLQECYNDAIYYRDEMHQHFLHGRVSLRQRTVAERLFWAVLKKLAYEKNRLPKQSKDLAEIDNVLADIYYGNFSVFQSLPDAWAIDQLFPVMPVHRLDEFPSRQGILSDITCDSDGRIDRFIDSFGIKNTLDLHTLEDGEEYYLGVFLVGAYQETLGDLHNLLGDTNVVSIRVNDDGTFEFSREIKGDSVADILSYVEYDPRRILDALREKAEGAIRSGAITPADRYRIMQAFDDGLRGYTYFER